MVDPIQFLGGALVGVGMYWVLSRFLRGAGKSFVLVGSILIGGLSYFASSIIGLTLGMLFVTGILLEIFLRTKKTKISHSHLVFEGGGIRRGLTALEVGVINGLAPSGLFVLGLIDLLQKGFVQYSETSRGKLLMSLEDDFLESRNILNPKLKRQSRQEVALRKKKELNAAEDILLEIFEQNAGLPIGEFSIEPWIGYLRRSVETKTSGFDLVRTKQYYVDFMTHRFMGVASGYFESQDYIGWMVLSLYVGEPIDEKTTEILKQYRPPWLREGDEFYQWLMLVKSLSW